MFEQTATLTFGDRSENHKGMQIIGKEIQKGLSKSDLIQARDFFEEKGANTYLVNLRKLLPTPEDADEAYLLIVKDGVDHLLGKDKANELYKEQIELDKDTKAFMYGRVVDKKARHNLCFSDFEQSPDYANKKGTVVHFDRVPLTKALREALPQTISTLPELQCEGNYYYNPEKTYIGFHGDTERKIVIAARLGSDSPIHFRWYKSSEVVGNRFEYVLNHGDIYYMSDKTVGYDWKSRSILTLRHAAGPFKLVN